MKLLSALTLLMTGLLQAAPVEAPAVTPAPGSAPVQKFYRPQHTGAVKHQSGGLDVVNAASFEAGVSPGGLATVFGQNLSSASGTYSSTTDPLPFQLADVRVAVNGVFAPLFNASFNNNGTDQISFQVPYGTPTGPGAATVDVVDPSGTIVASTRADSFTEDPGIFAYGSNNYAVALHSDDGSLVGPNNRANPGEYLVLYTTGLGPLTVALLDGYGAPSNPLAYTQVQPQVLIDGEDARVFFSGLAPGFVGLYQVNIRVPSDVRPGLLDLQIVTPASTSAKVSLPMN